MSRAPPAWLETFQRAFGRVLTTPLDDRSGTWQATPGRYPLSMRDEVPDGPELYGPQRLAVYNRQYWFRLYGVLQGDYPLVCRLLGAFAFNQWARDHLVEQPPRSWDVQAVGERFGHFLLDRLGSHPRRQALAEAVAIDEATRRALLAPACARLRPGTFRPGQPLALAPGWTVVDEHWPLVALRAAQDPGEAAVELPAPWPEVQAWAIGAREGVAGFVELEPLQARLLRLLDEVPVEEALADLEGRLSPEERGGLPGQVERWLRQGLALGLWAAPR